MAADEEELKRRTFVLATKLQALCNGELGAAGEDESDYRDALTNVVSALEITVAKVLAHTGIPPGDFIELVRNTMQRLEEPASPKSRGVA